MIVQILTSAVILMIPIAFGAIGATINEKSGVLNIGIEGMMIMGAFISVVGSYYSGSALIGVMCGMLAGAFLGLIHSVIVVEFGGPQAVSSLGISLFGLGGTSYLLKVIFKTSGNSPKVATLRTTEILRGIPIIGNTMADISPYIYTLIIVVILSTYILNKTALGLHVKSVGEDPKTAESVGINVWKIRYFAMMISGGLAGLGGSFLTVGDLGFFQENMTAGRGFIALAAMILGKWNIKWVVASSFLFGLFEVLKIQAQLSDVINISPDILNMLPYAITLVVLALFVGSANGPKANAKPYLKQKYIV